MPAFVDPLGLLSTKDVGSVQKNVSDPLQLLGNRPPEPRPTVQYAPGATDVPLPPKPVLPPPQQLAPPLPPKPRQFVMPGRAEDLPQNAPELEAPAAPIQPAPAAAQRVFKPASFFDLPKAAARITATGLANIGAIGPQAPSEGEMIRAAEQHGSFSPQALGIGVERSLAGTARGITTGPLEWAGSLGEWALGSAQDPGSVDPNRRAEIAEASKTAGGVAKSLWTDAAALVGMAKGGPAAAIGIGALPALKSAYEEYKNTGFQGSLLAFAQSLLEAGPAAAYFTAKPATAEAKTIHAAKTAPPRIVKTVDTTPELVGRAESGMTQERVAGKKLAQGEQEMAAERARVKDTGWRVEESTEAANRRFALEQAKEIGQRRAQESLEKLKSGKTTETVEVPTLPKAQRLQAMREARRAPDLPSTQEAAVRANMAREPSTSSQGTLDYTFTGQAKNLPPIKVPTTRARTAGELAAAVEAQPQTTGAGRTAWIAAEAAMHKVPRHEVPVKPPANPDIQISRVTVNRESGKPTTSTSPFAGTRPAERLASPSELVPPLKTKPVQPAAAVHQPVNAPKAAEQPRTTYMHSGVPLPASGIEAGKIKELLGSAWQGVKSVGGKLGIGPAQMRPGAEPLPSGVQPKTITPVGRAINWAMDVNWLPKPIRAAFAKPFRALRGSSQREAIAAAPGTEQAKRDLLQTILTSDAYSRELQTKMVGATSAVNDLGMPEAKHRAAMEIIRQERPASNRDMFTPDEWSKIQTARETNDAFGRRVSELGMADKGAFEALEGKHLRVTSKESLDRSVAGIGKRLWNATRSWAAKRGYAHSRKFRTLEEMESAGFHPVNDVGYNLLRDMMVKHPDIVTGRVLEHVAKNSDWVQDQDPGGWVKFEGQRWGPITKTVEGGTQSNKARYVHPQIAQVLKGVESDQLYQMSRLESFINTQFKKTRTVRDIRRHGRQFLENAWAADMNANFNLLDPRDFNTFRKSFATALSDKGDPLWDEFKTKTSGTEASFVRQILDSGAVQRASGLDELISLMEKRAGATQRSGAVRALGAADDFMTNLYRAMDTAFRFAIYSKYRRMGYSISESEAKFNGAIPSYSEASMRLRRWERHPLGPAFISASMQAMENTARSLSTVGGAAKAAKWALAASMMTNYALAKANLSKEDWEKIRKQMRVSSLAVVLPWTQRNGAPVALDFKYLFGGSFIADSMIEASKKNYPESAKSLTNGISSLAMNGGLLQTAFESLYGRELGGREIWDAEDSAGMKAALGAAHAVESLAIPPGASDAIKDALARRAPPREQAERAKKNKRRPQLPSELESGLELGGLPVKTTTTLRTANELAAAQKRREKKKDKQGTLERFYRRWMSW